MINATIHISHAAYRRDMNEVMALAHEGAHIVIHEKSDHGPVVKTWGVEPLYGDEREAITRWLREQGVDENCKLI